MNKYKKGTRLGTALKCNVCSSTFSLKCVAHKTSDEAIFLNYLGTRDVPAHVHLRIT